jgi:hypothetical protein
MTVKLALAEVRGFHAQSLGHSDPRGASALSGPLDIGKTPRARCQNEERHVCLVPNSISYSRPGEIPHDSTCTCGVPRSLSRALRGGRIIREATQ